MLRPLGPTWQRTCFTSWASMPRPRGHERSVLTRVQVLKHFANTPRCVIAMEACASSRYFARELTTLGHETKLIPPQYVKACVRGQKNDYNDASAIAEAVRVPQMRGVTVKTVAQQDLQALTRLYEGMLRTRTALVNRLRELLAEYGIVRSKEVKYAAPSAARASRKMPAMA